MKMTILVDWQNLYKACEENRFSLDSIIGEIRKKGLKQGKEIQEIRLFVPCYQSIGPWKNLNKLQIKYGLEISVCPVLKNGDEGKILKDLVDLEILKWVMNHIHLNVDPQKVVLVSGDAHFLLTANEIKRRNKEVEFWFIKGEASLIISQYGKVLDIGIVPPIYPTKENRYLNLLETLHKGKKLSEDEKIRLNYFSLLMSYLKLDRPAEWSVVTGSSLEIGEILSKETGIPAEESREIIEALMAIGITRVYPTKRYVLSIETSSPIFSWILSSGFIQENK